MRASTDPRAEIQRICATGPLGLVFSALLVLASAYFVPWPYILSGALLVVPNGALMLALVVLSWRYYHFWLSWLIWVVPGTALVGVAAVQAIFPAVRLGLVSPAAAMAIAWGFAGVGFFLAVLVFRRHIRKWFAI